MQIVKIADTQLEHTQLLENGGNHCHTEDMYEKQITHLSLNNPFIYTCSQIHSVTKRFL